MKVKIIILIGAVLISLAGAGFTAIALSEETAPIAPTDTPSSSSPSISITSDPGVKTVPTDPGSRGGKSHSSGKKEYCQQVWDCSAWSECIAGDQTRTCVKANSCDKPGDEPKQKRTCSVATKAAPLDPDSALPVQPTEPTHNSVKTAPLDPDTTARVQPIEPNGISITPVAIEPLKPKTNSVDPVKPFDPNLRPIDPLPVDPTIPVKPVDPHNPNHQAKPVKPKPIDVNIAIKMGTVVPLEDPTIRSTSVPPVPVTDPHVIVTPTKTVPIKTPNKPDNNNPPQSEQRNSGGGGACQEIWFCEEWSVCENGKQTRKCTLDNECLGGIQHQPETEQHCTDSESSDDASNSNSESEKEESNGEEDKSATIEASGSEETPTQASLDPTGFLTSQGASSLFWAVIIVVVLGLLIYWGAAAKSK